MDNQDHISLEGKRAFALVVSCVARTPGEHQRTISDKVRDEAIPLRFAQGGEGGILRSRPGSSNTTQYYILGEEVGER